MATSKANAAQQVQEMQSQLDTLYGGGAKRRYKVERIIGRGSYGIVGAATDLTTNMRVAIKRISSDVFKDSFLTHRILREIWMMAHFRGHPNLMGLLDIAPLPHRNFSNLFIIMELMDHDLKTVLRSGQPLTEEHVQFFIYQILCGLLYIHKAGVVHRDITPANVLVNANCDLKICDFGLARSLQRQDVELTDYVTMRWYRAPELVMEDVQYTHQVDVWGCGCILAEFLSPTRGILFPGEDRIKQLGVILNVIGTPNDEDMAGIGSEMARRYIRKHHSNLKGVDFRTRFRTPSGAPLSEPALDLLQRMLRFNPSKRITVVEAMRHPYLSEFYDPDDEMSVSAFTLDKESFENLGDVNAVKDLIFNTVLEIRREITKELGSGIDPGLPASADEGQGKPTTQSESLEQSDGSVTSTSSSSVTDPKALPVAGDGAGSGCSQPVGRSSSLRGGSSSSLTPLTKGGGAVITPLKPTAERVPSSAYYAASVGVVTHTKSDALSDGEWSGSEDNEEEGGKSPKTQQN